MPPPSSTTLLLANTSCTSAPAVELPSADFTPQRAISVATISAGASISAASRARWPSTSMPRPASTAAPTAKVTMETEP